MKKNKPLKAGVIGLGVGEQHAFEYSATEGVELVAVADLDFQKAKKIAQKLNVPKFYTDWKILLDDPEIDVVSICSFDDVHAKQTIHALNNGKHVMVEKPAVMTRNEAKDVITALRKSKTFLTSNLILRRSPRFENLKNEIENGQFGNIFHIEGDYQHNIEWKITKGWRGKMKFYCTVYGGGIHLIDLMRWLIDDEITEVMAYGTKIPTHNSNFKYPDTITAIMKYKSGTIGKTMTTFSPQRSKFHALNIFGTKKTFINDIPFAKKFNGTEEKHETQDRTDYPGINKGDLIPNFINSIKTDNKPEINEIDIFRVMDVCFSIWQSVESGKPVKVRYLV